MKKALYIGIATLLGLGACDSDTGGEGSSSGTSGGTTSDPTNVTVSATTPMTGPPVTTGSSSGSTTIAESSSTGGSSTSGTTTATSGTDGESSSSSGGQSSITPCQPEMSHSDIHRWQTEAPNRMPTFADIALPMQTMSSQAASVGGLANVPDPQAGGGGFIEDPDGGGTSVECDVWAQDCPEGEKCAAWANDGGSSWNALRCVPVADDPVGPGETCTVEGSGVSGIDNCDADSMCWAVDGGTNEGTCVALCEGSPEAPTCAADAAACSIVNDGVLILCLPICNPLAEECGEGQGCFPVGEVFQCAPAAGDAEPGESCEFINACEDGVGCVTSALVPDCPAGSAGCCSSFCELEAADPGCLEGQECVPWFGEEPPDACLEGIGICATPA